MAFFSGGDDRAKLMALYVLGSFRAPMTPDQLYTAQLCSGGASYFEFGQAYNELAEQGYIVAVPSGMRQLVSLTPKGRETLELFGQELARSTRDAIDAYAAEHREEYRRSNSVVGEVRPVPGGYEARLSMLDQTGELASVSLRLPTAEYAFLARENWLAKADSVYLALLAELTKPCGESEAEAEEADTEG